MTVILACAWQPRGELPRLQRYWSRLQDIYSGFAVSIKRGTDEESAAWLHENGVTVAEYDDWSGRHTVLRAALSLDGGHIQYCDLDRMIRWVETRPDELHDSVEKLQAVDCMIFGRTEQAYLTHPRALHETEKVPNAMFSYWFGREMDLCAGSKGFSRVAAEYVLAHSVDTDALRMDVEWPVLLKRAGFSWDYAEVDGLDWESADQFQDVASDQARQQKIAEAYDEKVKSWSLRVTVSQKLTTAGLDAFARPLQTTGNDPLPYILYEPDGLRSRDDWPLIVFLHGSGARGADLKWTKIKALPKYLEGGNLIPAYVLVPLCPKNVMWDGVQDKLDVLLDNILRDYPIDRDRVVLTGFSMGGLGTWSWATHAPDRFAAIMPVAGSIDTVENEKLKMPIWIISSEADQAVPVVGADQTMKSLKAIGADVQYTRLKDKDHNQVAEFIYQNAATYEWLLAQRRQTTR